MAISMQLKLCENNELYLLIPIPEGVPQDELDAAVAAGELKIMDGMLCQSPTRWEERGGELWYDTGIEGELFGEPADPWAKALDENGLFRFMTSRFEKAE